MNEVSIFHEYKPLEKISPPEGKIEIFEETLEEGLYGYGIAILNTLYKYCVLNKKNLEKCLNIKRSSSWKLNMMPKMLKILGNSDLIDDMEMRKDNRSY